MLYDDDDELDRPALSGTHQLERADHRARERKEFKERRERLSRQGNTRILLGVLKNIVGFVLPKNGKVSRAPKTMTHKEEEQQRTHRADIKASPDQLLSDAAAQEQAEQARHYESEDSASG